MELTDKKKTELAKKLQELMGNLSLLIDSMPTSKEDDDAEEEPPKEPPAIRITTSERSPSDPSPQLDDERLAKRALQRQKIKQVIGMSAPEHLQRGLSIGIPVTPSKQISQQTRGIFPLAPDARMGRRSGGFTTPQNPKKVSRPNQQKKVRAPSRPTSKPAKSKTVKSTEAKAPRPKCSICGYKAKDIGDLSKHRSRKHPVEASKSAQRKVRTTEKSTDLAQFAIDFARETQRQKQVRGDT